MVGGILCPSQAYVLNTQLVALFGVLWIFEEAGPSRRNLEVGLRSLKPGLKFSSVLSA